MYNDVMYAEFARELWASYFLTGERVFANKQGKTGFSPALSPP